MRRPLLQLTNLHQFPHKFPALSSPAVSSRPLHCLSCTLHSEASPLSFPSRITVIFTYQVLRQRRRWAGDGGRCWYTGHRRSRRIAPTCCVCSCAIGAVQLPRVRPQRVPADGRASGEAAVRHGGRRGHHDADRGVWVLGRKFPLPFATTYQGCALSEG